MILTKLDIGSGAGYPQIRWYCRRLTWETGSSLVMPSLPEALSFFYVNLHTDMAKVQPFIFLTEKCIMGQVVGKVPPEHRWKEPDHFDYMVHEIPSTATSSVPNGPMHMIPRRERAIYGNSYDQLRQSMMMALLHRMQKGSVYDDRAGLWRETGVPDWRSLRRHVEAHNRPDCTPAKLYALWANMISKVQN